MGARMNRLLIVEDEEALRELMSFNLTKAGYDVVEAENANDALIFLRRLHLILLFWIL